EELGRKDAALPYAELEPAHRLVKIGGDAEHLVEEGHPFAVLPVGEAVDLLQELEGLDDRDVPPKLRALAEDHADRRNVEGALPVRDEAVAVDLARGRRQDAGKHL